MTGSASGNTASWWEVANYLYPLSLGWSINVHAFNLNSWKKLDPKVQEFITAEMKKYEDKMWQTIDDAMADERCVGGSVDVEFDAFAHRRWMRYYVRFGQAVARGLGWRPGALQFCRSSVFRDLGGYDETIFVGEDVEFHWRLDELARQRGGSHLGDDAMTDAERRRAAKKAMAERSRLANKD